MINILETSNIDYKLSGEIRLILMALLVVRNLVNHVIKIIVLANVLASLVELGCSVGIHGLSVLLL